MTPMPISRYPRPGHPLAPIALKTILTALIPKKFLEGAATNMVQLCDLNKGAWETFSPEVCHQLGLAIVEAVRTGKLTKTILRTTLPSVPLGKSIENLELEQRTYNCLCKMQLDGQLGGPEDLSKRTIQEILKLEHFGVKSLVDLLTSLEAGDTVTIREVTEEVKSEESFTLSEGTLASVHFPHFRNLRLPSLPAGTKLTDLNLRRRTYNCLVNHGLADRIAHLASLTLGEAMEIPGFGMQCLVDYLGTADRIQRGEKGNPEKVAAPVDHFGEMSAHQYLEDELRDLVRQSFKKRADAYTSRNTKLVLIYYGCDGGGGTSLRELGSKYGLTKERVRQICDRSLKRLNSIGHNYLDFGQ